MSEVKKRFEDGLDTIKTLTRIEQNDFDTLRQVAPQAREWVGELVQLFYDTLFAHPRTAAVFRPGERPAREETLKRWYLSLFEAGDDEAFWCTQGRIAFAHIRRHVNNEFMIGIAAVVSEWFMAKAVEAFGYEKGLKVAQSLSRILNAVVGLTAEGYDVMSQIAFSESTGADPQLVDRLIQQSVNSVQEKLFG